MVKIESCVFNEDSLVFDDNKRPQSLIRRNPGVLYLGFVGKRGNRSYNYALASVGGGKGHAVAICGSVASVCVSSY